MSYEQITPLADIGILVWTLVASICFLVLVGYITSERKSKSYRKVIMDMYVSAKIKQFAKEDNIDIDAEFESFKKWKKKDKLESKIMDLDDAVEEELKERVQESKLDKKK
jgi:hypothetical protein